MKVLQTFRGILLSMLNKYPTSAAEDEAILRMLRQHLKYSAANQSASNAMCSREKYDINDDAYDCSQILSEDQMGQLSEMDPNSDIYWRTVSAVTYRLTRKRILITAVQQLDELIEYFDYILVKTPTLKAGDHADFTTDEDNTDYLQVWNSTVRPHQNITLGTDHIDAETADNGRRQPTFAYKRKFRQYIWDATNPFQWPEW